MSARPATPSPTSALADPMRNGTAHGLRHARVNYEDVCPGWVGSCEAGIGLPPQGIDPPSAPPRPLHNPQRFRRQRAIALRVQLISAETAKRYQRGMWRDPCHHRIFKIAIGE